MNFLLLAIRNIAHYKRKTFIAGSLIIISLIIMIIGNSLIDKAVSTLKAGFTHTLSGDILIRTVSKEEITLFGSMEDSVLSFLGYKNVFGNVEIPLLPEYNQLKETLLTDKRIRHFTPILSGSALVSDLREDSPGLYSTFFGIDPVSYYRMFGDQLEFKSGGFLLTNETALMLSQNNQTTIMKNFGFWADTNQNVRVINSTTGSVRIKEMPVRGVFSFKNSKISTFNQINFVNAAILREMIGVQTEVVKIEDLSAEDSNLLSDSFDIGSLDQMIDIDNIIENTDSSGSLLTELENTLDTKNRSLLVEPDAWHFLLIRLENSGDQDNVISSLNKEFKDKSINAEAISWKAGAGSFFVIFSITRVVLNTFISILLIVIIFILMNTLVISIIERTSELGTMRALGAKRPFIIKMFLSETLLVSLIFGTCGLVLSFVTALILNGLHITTNNEFFELLFSGKVLMVYPDLINVIRSCITIVLVSLFATIIYPVGVALRIQPLRAIDPD